MTNETTGLPPIAGSRRDGSRDRPAAEPGGCECRECGCIFIGAEWHDLCRMCDSDRDQHVGGRCIYTGEIV